MDHYPALFLKEGKNSLGFYATKSPKNLVVFVHGFSGTALNTWNAFSSIMTGDPEYSNVDLLFYGYNSFEGYISDQGRELKKFLAKYISVLPSNFYDKSRGLDYKRVVIAAHSQGAVVSRLALIAAINDGDEWRKKCRLVFFAPAHNGSKLHNLMLAVPGLGKPISLLVGYFYNIINTLQIGSKELLELEKLVDSYKNSSEKNILKAYTLEVYNDKVVKNWPYCFDDFHPESPLRGISHTLVCKPVLKKYILPIDIIQLKLL